MKTAATITLVLSALLLSSCATSNWVKEGVTQQAGNADMAECRQLARREARNLAWDDRFGLWSSYFPDGYHDYTDHYWLYAWQRDDYVRQFDSDSLMQDHSYSLTNFCMRSKGYTLEQSDREG